MDRALEPLQCELRSDKNFLELHGLFCNISNFKNSKSTSERFFS